MTKSSLIPLGRRAAYALAASVVMAITWLSPAAAERINNPVAEFTGVDKITGRIITFDVYINETVQFGALQVTPAIRGQILKSLRPIPSSRSTRSRWTAR